MREYLPKGVKSSASSSLITAFFAITLISSIFVYAGFPVGIATAQSLPQALLIRSQIGFTTFSGVDNSNVFTDPTSDILQQQREQATPFDPTNGGLVTQYPDSQIYPYQDPYQIQSPLPQSPTQTLPEQESLPLENSIVDIPTSETTIVSVIDGNNASLQQGATTTSNIAMFTIQGTDDIAIADVQCSLDNVLQDPFICGTNPIVVENIQPGTHLFQIVCRLCWEYRFNTGNV